MDRITWHWGLPLMLLICLITVSIQLPLLAEKKAGQGKVSINQAGLEQLQTLEGVGPAMAKRIIEHRTKNGPFKKTEDLMSVKGMGEKKFQKIKARLTL